MARALARGTILRERYRIILDLQEPGVVSSSTLGVFMAYVEELREKTAGMGTVPEIKLAVDDSRVRNVLALLGFPIYPSVYEAVEAFLDEDT